MTALAHAATVDEVELASLAKALGHPARVRALRLLLARDTCCCGELVDEIGLAQATVSQHLKVLRSAGLIRGEIDPPRTCYCADAGQLARLRDALGALLDGAAAVHRAACDGGR